MAKNFLNSKEEKLKSLIVAFETQTPKMCQENCLKKTTFQLKDKIIKDKTELVKFIDDGNMRIDTFLC